MILILYFLAFVFLMWIPEFFSFQRNLFIALFVCIIPGIGLYSVFRDQPSIAARFLFTKDPSKITQQEAMDVYFWWYLPWFIIAALFIVFY